MICTKLLNVLLSVFLFVKFCDSQKCPDANIKVADIDLAKFDDYYTHVGFLELSSTNPDVTDSSSVKIENKDECTYKRYKFETDVNANTMRIAYQNFGVGIIDGYRLIKFDHLPQGYGDFNSSTLSQISVSHVKFLRQSTQPEIQTWQIISICKEVKDQKGIQNVDTNLVYFFLNIDTSPEANTFPDKLDEVVRENKFQVVEATNYCPSDG